MKSVIISGGYGFNEKHTKDGGQQTGIKIPDHVWKVVVILEPGQGIADINSSTPLIVVDIPNDQSSVGKTWHDTNNGFRVTLGELEQRINSNGIEINFFSHLPEEIQRQLKQKPIGPLPVPAASAFLLADSGQDDVLDVHERFFSPYEFSVWEGGFGEGTFSKQGVPHNGFSQIQLFEDRLASWTARFERNLLEDSVTQVSSLQNHLKPKNTFEDSVAQVSSTEITIVEPAVFNQGVSEDSSLQVSIIKSGGIDLSTTEVGIAQVGPPEAWQDEFSATQFGTTKIGTIQQNLVQQQATQIDTTQINIGEVKFSTSLMTLYKLLSGHSHVSSQKSESTANLESLLGQELLDLSIKVRDLPTGQLAEAQLTRFDADGHPVAGTILLDDDANGLGWFIDPTPWESSEFSTQNTAYNLQATEDSAAYGRYDLLTTILGVV